jgi:hypothetical protein
MRPGRASDRICWREKIRKPLRLLALRLILEKRETSLYDAVRQAFEVEFKEKAVLGLQRMALVVSENENPGLEDLAAKFMNHADYIVRTYGTDWVRKTRQWPSRRTFERLSSVDPSELVRKRAAHAMELLNMGPYSTLSNLFDCS